MLHALDSQHHAIQKLKRESQPFHDLFVLSGHLLNNTTKTCILHDILERLSKKVRAVGEAMEGCVGLDNRKGCRSKDQESEQNVRAQSNDL